MLPLKKSVLSLKERRKTHWFSYLQFSSKSYKSFMTDPLNIVFDKFGLFLLFCVWLCRFCVFFHSHHNGQWPPTSKYFGLWLLGYRIEFRCPYIPQCQYLSPDVHIFHNANSSWTLNSDVQLDIFVFWFLANGYLKDHSCWYFFRFHECEKLTSNVLQLDEVQFYYKKDSIIFDKVDCNANMQSRICIVSTGLDYIVSYITSDNSSTSLNVVQQIYIKGLYECM